MWEAIFFRSNISRSLCTLPLTRWDFCVPAVLHFDVFTVHWLSEQRHELSDYYCISKLPSWFNRLQSSFPFLVLICWWFEPSCSSHFSLISLFTQQRRRIWDAPGLLLLLSVLLFGLCCIWPQTSTIQIRESHHESNQSSKTGVTFKRLVSQSSIACERAWNWFEEIDSK